MGAYAVIAGTGPIITKMTGIAEYADNGDPCDGVVLNNGALLRRTVEIFDQYFSDLRNSGIAYDDLRSKFRQKIKWSFGIDVGTP